MNNNKLTIKDSALSFLVGFLLCQLGVLVSTCITFILYKLSNADMEQFKPFLNSATAYFISAMTLYIVMLCVFFYFNKNKENTITQKPQLKKIFIYILVALTSFIALYPIIVCVDSLLIRCGIKISSLTYQLTTKNYFISLLPLVIAPAVCEELFFRGLILSGIKKHGKVFAITITTLMFAIFHMSISQTVYPILMGLLLSVIMFYENNIYYCIVVHMTNNFLSLTLSYFKISLIFKHWTYILLAIILAVTFVCIITFFTFNKKRTHEKQKPTKQDILYLSVSLLIMILLWFLVNFA